MLRFSLFLLTALVASAQPQSADVLAKVTDTYSHLQAIHVVASRSDTVALSGRTVISEIEYEYAAKGPGRFRAWKKTNSVEGLAVSDGSNTWKALPKAKQWMKLEAASFGDDPEEEKAPRATPDFPHSISNLLVSRYPAIAKEAGAPEILREDTYNLKSGKVHCYVLRTRIRAQVHELWIDKTRYLVLRDVQQGKQDTRGGSLTAAIEIKVKEIQTNSDVDESLFSFEPEKKWAEVQTLALPEEQAALLTGRPAIDFTLKSLEGEPLRLSSLRGKVVVLDFWASWCGPCRKELPLLEKLRSELGNSVEFIGVNDEEPGTVKGFRKSNGYEMAVLLDRKRDVNHQYGVQAIPTLLVIDANGVVRQHWVGTRSERDLRKAIEAAASGK